MAALCTDEHQLVGDIAFDADRGISWIGPSLPTIQTPGVVRRRRAMGQTLWDGPRAVFVTGATAEDDLELRTGNYYRFLARQERVLRESDSVRGRKPNLDSLTDIFSLIADPPAEGLALAGAVAVVFHTSKGPRVWLHSRSSSTVNAAEAEGPAPAFGFEPNWGRGDHRSHYGFIAYNVFREYLEEFFEVDGVSQSGTEPKTNDPNWVFNNEPGRRLEAEIGEGRVSLTCTGVASSLTVGDLGLLLTLEFTGPDYYKWVLMNATGGDEANRSFGDARLWDEDLSSDHVTALIQGAEKCWSFGRLTLDRTRRLLSRDDQPLAPAAPSTSRHHAQGNKTP